jgi:hypothetical protein
MSFHRGDILFRCHLECPRGLWPRTAEVASTICDNIPDTHRASNGDPRHIVQGLLASHRS